MKKNPWLLTGFLIATFTISLMFSCVQSGHNNQTWQPSHPKKQGTYKH